jgi:hypothetical protein
MSKTAWITSQRALTLVFACGVTRAAETPDLSSYRGFHFGADPATVAKKAGANGSEARTIHNRPALIQELAWRPRSLGTSVQPESVSEVDFSFYNGELYQVEVNYDRHEIEGLTVEDIVGALSSIYGPASKPADAAKSAADSYGDREQVVARWQDEQYSFHLIRSSYGPSYGPSFKLIGVLKRLDAPAQAAISEAKRLDEREAPQRDAARAASEQEAQKAVLEKARLANIPRFRP